MILPVLAVARNRHLIGLFQAVFTLVTPSASFIDVDGNIFDDVKEWSGPFVDAHPLGVRPTLTLMLKFCCRPTTQAQPSKTHPV